MSELEISERAFKAACDAYDAALDREFREYGTVVHEGQDHAEQAAARAAAPIIVAAELWKLWDELKRKAEILGDEQAAGVLYAALTLQERAKELDGWLNSHGLRRSSGSAAHLGQAKYRFRYWMLALGRVIHH